MLGVTKKGFNGSQLIYWVAALSYLADRTIKQVALIHDQPISESLVSFGLLLNRGAIFSLEIPDLLFWLLILVAVLALGHAWLFAWRNRRDLLPVLVLITLGAASNLIDRMTLDATVDYIGFLGIGAINLADVMIVGGLVSMAKSNLSDC